jgi:hypothetical protein
MGWLPIATAPKSLAPMIVVRGVFADRHYVTDPWCVFWQEGAWQRWPHSDPPTHWMPLPELTLDDRYTLTEAGAAMLEGKRD